MIRATTKPAVSATVATHPSKRIRTRTRITDTEEPATLPLPVASANKDRRRFEDAFGLAVLCVLGAVILATTAGMAREFIDDLLRYGSFDLMRGFSGM